MKKTLMVSNTWRPEENAVCSQCGKEIEYAWGDYSFRYYEKKDQSDLCVLCKSCAASLTNSDRKVRVINRSPLMDMINLRNSGWKTQPTRSFGSSPGSSGSAAEADSPDKKDTD